MTNFVEYIERQDGLRMETVSEATTLLNDYCRELKTSSASWSIYSHIAKFVQANRNNAVGYAELSKLYEEYVLSNFLALAYLIFSLSPFLPCLL